MHKLVLGGDLKKKEEKVQFVGRLTLFNAN